jgi:hypothetical protein
MMKMMTTTELAADFDTTPRELRKFLRSDASGIESVGKGSRYSLPSTKREVASLRKRFDAWGAAKAQTEPEAPEGDDAPDEG